MEDIKKQRRRACRREKFKALPVNVQLATMLTNQCIGMSALNAIAKLHGKNQPFNEVNMADNFIKKYNNEIYINRNS